MKKFIAIDGVKYKVDPNDDTKALLDGEGKPVPYVEEPALDLSKVSLEDLKKANPEIAKAFNLLDDLQKKQEDIVKEREEAERKAKEDQGKWQEIADDERKKRTEAENIAKKNEEVLGKYKATVNTILEDTLKTIPEDKRSLIPSDYSPRKKLEYITANAKTLGVTANNDKGGNIPPNDKDINLDEESKVQKEYDELLKKGKDRTSIESKQMLELAKKIKEIRLANANAK